MRLTIIIALTLAGGIALAGNLIPNGDFEQELDVGWNYQQGGTGTRTTERRAWSSPDTGHYCFIRHYGGGGYTKLWQLVDVAGPDLDFSFWASWAIGGGSSTCWPVASVILEYYDHRGIAMGETRWYRHDQYCNWQPANNRNLISIIDPSWMQHALNVRREIEDNLPAVKVEDVKRIGLSLYCYTSSG